MTKTTITALVFTLAALPALGETAKNELTAGATYSSLHGAVALVGFDGHDIGGSGVDLSLNYRKGKTGNGGQAILRYGRDLAFTGLGQDAQLIFGAEVDGSNWSDEAYQSQTQKLSLALGAGLSPGASYTAKLFWQKDNLSDLGATASPLVTAEQGQSTSAGLALDGHFGHIEGGALPVSGLGLDTGLSWAGLGERKSTSAYAALTFAQPIGADKALVFRAEGGVIRGLDGQEVSILDRAFLGGMGGPRGFAFGGIGPRDFVDGSVDTPLGGRRYATVSSELRADFSERLSIGAFADGGAVWDLGDLTGAMGAIDDSQNFRSAVGLAVYYDTALGKISLNLAKPIRSEPHDGFNQISLGLMLKR